MSIEGTGHNKSVLERNGIPVEVVERVIIDYSAIKETRPSFAPPNGFTRPYNGEYVGLEDYSHQKDCFNKFKDLQIEDDFIGGIFAEMGTGKTKIGCDLINYHFCEGRIDAVVVIAKKGVHEQWGIAKTVNGQDIAPSPVDMFTQKDIETEQFIWSGKAKDNVENLLNRNHKLKWCFFNFDSIIHAKASKQFMDFLRFFEGRVAILGDETHYLKSKSAKRTKAAKAGAQLCNVRYVMTGTPIAKNLEDEWSQIDILSSAILGHKYASSFRAEYCVMGGFEYRQVVGSKNIDKFKEVTAPYIFRIMKKDCLDLPEKSYRPFEFKLSAEQLEAIDEIKKTAMFCYDGGVVQFKADIVIQSKIQEISNGYLRHDDGVIYFPNPRMDALLNITDDLGESALIWGRFKPDIKSINEALPNRCAVYYGETKDADRIRAKDLFMQKDKDFFLATTAAAGEGVDGLQSVASVSIYYSNSFNSLHRWQSEDRIHRLGMGDKALYIDILAKGCLDYPLLKNLQTKADLAALVLDINRELGIVSTGQAFGFGDNLQGVGGIDAEYDINDEAFL